MAYSQVQVMLGGAVHIPIVIGLLKFCDNKTKQSYTTQKAAEEKAAAAEAKAAAAAKAKAKAASEAKAKAAAEAKAAAAKEKPAESE